ncbi:hypothetical protein LP420_36800 [Massilia sp. B-10]|nr:hypothetical protein LP420_36800 [Massilia sp. B-10]
MPDTAIPLASLICRGIVGRIANTPYRVGDKAFNVRCSIGLIEVSAGMQMKDAISTADRACREAKSGHSDSLVIYERHAAAFLEREAEAEPGGAAGQHRRHRRSMFLEMQPIMSLKAPEASLNFEVLLRMREFDGSISQAGPSSRPPRKADRSA